MTTVTLSSYFTDRKFIEYFGNVIGRVRFELPGVFVSNPHAEVVNQSLWTLKPEFFCYAIMASLLLFSLISRERFLIMIIAASIGFFAARILGVMVPLSGHELTYAFLLGAAGYIWKGGLPLNSVLFGACAVSAIAIYSYQLFRLDLLAIVAATYCTLYLGMVRIPGLPFLKHGDYSYGIYLYGYPIQQGLVYFAPVLREWWMVFLIAAPVTTLLAVLSWHAIEKPVLALRKCDWRTWAKDGGLRSAVRQPMRP